MQNRSSYADSEGVFSCLSGFALIAFEKILETDRQRLMYICSSKWMTYNHSSDAYSECDFYCFMGFALIALEKNQDTNRRLCIYYIALNEWYKTFPLILTQKVSFSFLRDLLSYILGKFSTNRRLCMHASLNEAYKTFPLILLQKVSFSVLRFLLT